jgi:hypothetical protein
MRRLSVLYAAAGIAVTALAAASPAEAAFQVIRWQDTGFCRVWGQDTPMFPWPVQHTIMVHKIPTFTEAMTVKDHLVKKGACKL